MVGSKKVVGIWPDTTGVSAEAGSPVHADEQRPVVPDEPIFEVSHAAADHDRPVDPDWEAAWDAPAPSPARSWLAIFCAAAAVLWLAVYSWWATAGLTRVPAVADLPPHIGTALTPALLLMLVGMFTQRGSARAVTRHLGLLDRLDHEQHRLDTRLADMTQRWISAQQQLRDQAMSVDALGTQAAAQLEAAGLAMQAQMDRNIVASAVLTERSETAQRHLESLTIAIPKVDEIATRLGDNLRQAGQAAYQAGGQIEAQIAAIGTETEQVTARIDAAQTVLQTRMQGLVDGAQAAQQSADGTSARFAAHLSEQRDAALAMLAELAAGLGSATDQARLALATMHDAMASDFDARIATIGATIGDGETRIQAITAQLDVAQTTSAALDNNLADIARSTEQRMAALTTTAQDRFALLGEAVTLADASVATLGQRISVGDGHATQLMSRAESLLIALDAVARELDQTLPGALGRLDAQVATSLDGVARLSPALHDSDRQAAGIVAQIGSAEDMLAAHNVAMATVRDALIGVEQHRADLSAKLAADSAHAHAAVEALIAGIGPQITAAMAQAQSAVDDGTAQSRAMIDALTSDIAKLTHDQVSTAIARAMGDGAAARLTELSAVADHAVMAASQASEKLMRQLITIADSSAALEQRAQQVTDMTAAATRDTLARQMAMLTEALQSTAVDLTRMLDADIADQAWDAYLKGDRSIFTRRAARVLTSAEARDVRRRYDDDADFRAQANRYIHDFEAMLRGVMDTQDGSSLSVTLLSSDAGKLYVALAQAIERLRQQ